MEGEKIIKRVVNNVRNIAQMKNIKIGDIERNCGMPIGKLSRFPNLTVVQVYKVAKYLGITIDELISSNTEKMIIEYKIEQLKEELKELELKKGETENE